MIAYCVNFLLTIKLNFMKQIKIFINFVIFSVLSFTQVTGADTSVKTNSLPVELKVAGTFKNQPLVQLNFTGTSEDNVFKIVITDQAGIELYNSDVKGMVFSKQFLLNSDDLGDAILYFEITGKKSGKKVLYKVKRQQQITQQMDVVKM